MKLKMLALVLFSVVDNFASASEPKSLQDKAKNFQDIRGDERLVNCLNRCLSDLTYPVSSAAYNNCVAQCHTVYKKSFTLFFPENQQQVTK